MPTIRRLYIVLLALSFATAGRLSAQEAACPDPDSWQSLVREHLTRYPMMELADMYKLLHQATKGAEHAVTSAEAASDWLDRELAQLGPGPAEPLVDRLGDRGQLVRIHLRPFTAEQGRPHRLVAAFVATTAGRYGGDEALSCALAAAHDLATRGTLPWPATAVAAYVSARATERYPAVHHSVAYVEHYRPAYRVIAVRLVDEALSR